MASYVITGVSRGMGWEFLRRLSSDPNNTVIGIVRDKPPTAKRVSEELPRRSNVTILEADVTQYESLKRASAEAAGVTGGRLDYLIANAGLNMSWDGLDPIGDLAAEPEKMSDYFGAMMNTNVLANINLYASFLPLILRGKAKKVVHLTSALGDVEFARDYELTLGSVYAASKAAMNMVTAKFAAQYRGDGVLFLGVCPGVVDTGQFNDRKYLLALQRGKTNESFADRHRHLPAVTPEEMAKFAPMLQKWQAYAPDFKGPVSPDAAVTDVLAVIDKCSVENGDSGANLSHFGNKQWL
ncbi:NAD(P)-binding protein [Apiospora marii]|uniref:NAD(P)-binding protein n=1 Tax=Apiospora marii TaxID=335849 RepID=A0ABR1SU24_9PEZI